MIDKMGSPNELCWRDRHDRADGEEWIRICEGIPDSGVRAAPLDQHARSLSQRALITQMENEASQFQLRRSQTVSACFLLTWEESLCQSEERFVAIRSHEERMQRRAQ
jgi:hypothetical protein